MARIFISYRREDTAAAAGRLYDRLVQHFGKGALFMDVDSLEMGEKFSEVVSKTVGTCDVLLALIGDRWLTATDSQGRLRLNNPDDWVRLEVATALRRDIRTVPVLVNGAGVPPRAELPGDLADLALRHACEITHVRFHSDVDRLIEALDRMLPSESTGRGDASEKRTERDRRDGPRKAKTAPSEFVSKARRGWMLAAKIGALVAESWSSTQVPIPYLNTVAALLPFHADAKGAMLALGIWFGPIAVLWDIKSRRDISRARNGVFWLASIFTAVLTSFTDIWSNPFVAFPVLGAVYLALAHKLILRRSWPQFLGGVAGAVGAYFTATWLLAAAPFVKHLGLMALILPWQAGYLAGINGDWGRWAGRVREFWRERR